MQGTNFTQISYTNTQHTWAAATDGLSQNFLFTNFLHS